MEGKQKMKNNLPFLSFIVLGQFIGGILGVICVFLFCRKDLVKREIYPGIYLLCPEKEYAQLPQSLPAPYCGVDQYGVQVFMVELLCSFFFVSVVLHVKYVTHS